MVNAEELGGLAAPLVLQGKPCILLSACISTHMVFLPSFQMGMYGAEPILLSMSSGHFGQYHDRRSDLHVCAVEHFHLGN